MRRTKGKLIMMVCLVAAICAGCGSTATNAEALVSDIPTTQGFAADAVADADLTKILTAGINAPSAMNKQPWHFSVVTDKDVLTEIADGMKMGKPPKGADGADKPTPPPTQDAGPKAGIADAPVAIIVSADEGSAFDAGLACQNMYVMANLLGYGSKIISSPTIALNGDRQDEYRKILDIPEDKSAVAILLIGKKADGVDGATGATERNPLETSVSYIK